MAVIEYFYAAHSGYAYIGSKLLSEVAATAGARIDHRPFDWHAVLAANGPNPTNGLTPQRRAYFSGREMSSGDLTRTIVEGAQMHFEKLSGN